MAETFDMNVGGTYAILYCVMIAFTLVAFIASSFIPVPEAVGNFLVASHGKTTVASDAGGDFYMSARNSANARTISMSFFAGGMGAWVVYSNTELGATPQISWFGILGYSAASGLPAIVIAIIGPKVKEMSGENAFTVIDFAYARFGRVMQLLVSCVSILYMFIFIVAELTSVANVYALLVDKATFEGQNLDYTTHIAVVVVVFTIFYTSVGGLPASIITDKVQAVIVIILMIILFFAVVLTPENRITPEQFSLASNATVDGVMAGVTLIIAVLCAELFNQPNWQRVWAAEDNSALRRGYLYAFPFIFLTMLFFGIMGMIAYGKDSESYDSFDKLAYLSFFDLLAPLHPFWHGLVLILVTAFCASSIDSLQIGIVGVFNKDILRYTSNGSTGKWISRFLLLLVNIPAIILSTKRYDVIPLFLVADLVCATTVLPLFLGLMKDDWGFLKAPTELGSFLGAICAIGGVLVNGKILNFTEATNWMGDVIAKGPFSYFWLTNGDICALCGPKTMITFIVTPLVGGFFTFFFSALDMAIRGDAAKKSLFGLAETNAVEEKIVDVDVDVEKEVKVEVDIEAKILEETA